MYSISTMLPSGFFFVKGLMLYTSETFFCYYFLSKNSDWKGLKTAQGKWQKGDLGLYLLTSDLI